MVSIDLKTLLIKVITSWQVIVMTVGLVLYFLLLFYVAKPRRRKRPAAYSPTEKVQAAPAGAAPPQVTEEDELGLEEKT
jgi:flagellar biosynthesis/type III secretory pathway M-ring protein FliF/YscJ